jgi:glycine/D-amino acid oxidase-like deaminating enzyme
MATVDFLIIGQGLAGSLLGWRLMRQGCRIMVVDDGLENASKIAAGLMNPITGMRFSKSSNVDVLLPVAKQCYAELASLYQQDFYIEKPMLRIFNSEKERLACVKRVNQPDYHSYLGELHPNFTRLNTPFGCLEQKQTGYLLTRPLLAHLKAFFIANSSYQQAVFDVGDICLTPMLRWRNMIAKRIIFCEGYRASQNPYFSWLPFQSVKGEILTLNHQQWLPDKLLNYGHWLIPLNTQQVRIGATFDRENLDSQITEQGRITLLNAVKTVLDDFQGEVVQHQAHIRPCTLDKQPFIGFHPEYPQLAIFNGFGAKGSLQIPYYAEQFVNALIKNTALPKPCDIHRYVTA